MIPDRRKAERRSTARKCIQFGRGRLKLVERRNGDRRDANKQQKEGS